jgi:hypothetical protein
MVNQLHSLTLIRMKLQYMLDKQYGKMVRRAYRPACCTSIQLTVPFKFVAGAVIVVILVLIAGACTYSRY